MNSTEFISYINEQITNEILLGSSKDQNRLTGLRNIKSDYTYISSKESNINAIDILKRLYKERRENESIYQDANQHELWLQEHVEAEMILKWLPKELDKNEVFSYFDTLIEIPKVKSSFKKYQDACVEHFGQKVDSSVILEYINGN